MKIKDVAFFRSDYQNGQKKNIKIFAGKNIKPRVFRCLLYTDRKPKLQM